MSVSVEKKRTSRFLDPWVYIALGSTGFVLLGFIAAGFFEKTLVYGQTNVTPGNYGSIKTFDLEPQSIGALRVDVNARIPDNTNLAYEIQLVDSQKKVLASAVKEAWNESGTWYEDGESGSWSESNLKGGIDIRTKKKEQVTLRIGVLEYGDKFGRELTSPKPNFIVSVKNGVVDTRRLWPGLFSTLFIGIITLFTVPNSGKKAISKKINDSDVSDRATVGGKNSLVRVKVDIAADETTPQRLNVELVINNSYGERVYAASHTTNIMRTTVNNTVKSGRGSLTLFFVFDKQDSYSFNVEVVPDAPVDKTTLTVRDSSKTLTAVEAIHITSDGEGTLNNTQTDPFQSDYPNYDDNPQDQHKSEM
ncbi:MAG: hypothetical protein AAF208_12255 [Cyanobacteria bacterium P01_A01_bin.45]